MAEYRPKLHRKGMPLPFGYFVSPIDPEILLPDVKKLEALEYAFRMKAKYKTTLSNCVAWLHAQTGQRMSLPGFRAGYRRWASAVRRKNGKALSIKRKQILEEKQKALEKNYGHHTIKLNDKDSVLALAFREAEKQAS